MIPNTVLSLCVISVLLSLVSSAMYMTLGYTLEQDNTVGSNEDDVSEKETKEHSRNKISVSFLLFAAFLGNIAVSCMLFLYYRVSFDDIILTLGTISFLWPSALIDYQTHTIPNRILIVALALRAAWFGLEALMNPGTAGVILMSSLIAGGVLMVTSLLCRIMIPRSIGMGDVKILAVMGLYLGMDKIWGAVFSSLLILFIVCIFLLAMRRADKKTEIAFAPFLLVGTFFGAFLTGI